jgi:flagellar protein FliJ
MAPSDRLKPVRRVAETRERDAARVLGEAQRQLQDQQAKLEQLLAFQQEYQGRFDTACRGGISAGQLQEYLSFLGRLQQAVAQQEQAVEKSRQASMERRRHWQAKHTRTQAIGKVMARLQEGEQQDQERREQKDTDERALRRGRGDV